MLGHSPSSIDQRISQAKRLGFGFAADTKKLPRITPGFVPDEEPNPLLMPKKKKLVPLDPIKSEDQLKKEREEEAKAIVKLIPTGKTELFVYPMDWDTIDSVCYSFLFFVLLFFVLIFYSICSLTLSGLLCFPFCFYFLFSFLVLIMSFFLSVSSFSNPV